MHGQEEAKGELVLVLGHEHDVGRDDLGRRRAEDGEGGHSVCRQWCLAALLGRLLGGGLVVVQLEDLDLFGGGLAGKEALLDKADTDCAIPRRHGPLYGANERNCA